jgi:hypothetical protein
MRVHGHIWAGARAVRLSPLLLPHGKSVGPSVWRRGFSYLVVILFASGMAVLSACGGSGSSSTETGTTVAQAGLGTEYVNIVTPLQQAEAQYQSTGGQTDAIPPLQSSFQSVGSSLLRVTWPGRTESDVRGLVSTFNAIESQLDLQLTDPTAVNSQEFSEYLSAERTDSNNVRTDLGLPITGTTP